MMKEDFAEFRECSRAFSVHTMTMPRSSSRAGSMSWSAKPPSPLLCSILSVLARAHLARRYENARSVEYGGLRTSLRKGERQKPLDRHVFPLFE